MILFAGLQKAASTYIYMELDSHPDLKGEVLHGAYTISPMPTFFAWEERAAALAKKYPYMKAIIVIREPVHRWYRAIHKQYIKEGGTLPYGKFMQSEFAPPPQNYLAKAIHDNFDALQLRYDFLVEHPENFFRDIYTFLGVEYKPPDKRVVNRSWKPLTVELVRQLNRFILFQRVLINRGMSYFDGFINKLG